MFEPDAHRGRPRPKVRNALAGVAPAGDGKEDYRGERLKKAEPKAQRIIAAKLKRRHRRAADLANGGAGLAFDFSGGCVKKATVKTSVPKEEPHILANMKWNGCQTATRGGAAAYSLPEAIIAIALIGLMMISLYAGFSTGFSIVRAGRENLRATQILLQRMETLRLCPWDALRDPDSFKNVTFVESFDPLGQLAGSGGGTVYTSDITSSVPTNLPAAYLNDLRVVTVSVYWTNSSSTGPHMSRRQMQTYVARDGLQKYVRGK